VDRRSADLVAEHPAQGERLVSDRLCIESSARIVREQEVAWILLQCLRRNTRRLSIGCGHYDQLKQLFHIPWTRWRLLDRSIYARTWRRFYDFQAPRRAAHDVVSVAELDRQPIQQRLIGR